MKISLIHPSFERPNQALNAYREWLMKSSGLHEIEYILSLDNRDRKINDYQRNFTNLDKVMVLKTDSDCVVQATNAAAKKSTGDILIYLSDDFGCPNIWDSLVAEKILMTVPSVLKVDDCLQQFDVRVLTIPIMNRLYYNAYGYFWFPEYKSMFCDTDLYETADKMDRLQFAPELKFPHRHPANPNPHLRAKNDSTYTQSTANWEQGKAVFERRKETNFA